MGGQFKAFNVVSVVVFTDRIRDQGVECRGDSDAEPAAARAGEASLCDEALVIMMALLERRRHKHDVVAKG